jgi:hypothetical protein
MVGLMLEHMRQQAMASLTLHAAHTQYRHHAAQVFVLQLLTVSDQPPVGIGLPARTSAQVAQGWSRSKKLR